MAKPIVTGSGSYGVKYVDVKGKDRLHWYKTREEANAAIFTMSVARKDSNARLVERA